MPSNQELDVEFRLSSHTVVVTRVFRDEIYIHMFNRKKDRNFHLTLPESQMLRRKLPDIMRNALAKKNIFLSEKLEEEKKKAKEILAKDPQVEDYNSDSS